MIPKPLPVIRVGDQALLLPKPEIWKCHYEGCKFRVVLLRTKAMEQAQLDHIAFTHYTSASRHLEERQ